VSLTSVRDPPSYTPGAKRPGDGSPAAEAASDHAHLPGRCPRPRRGLKPAPGPWAHWVMRGAAPAPAPQGRKGKGAKAPA